MINACTSDSASFGADIGTEFGNAAELKKCSFTELTNIDVEGQ